MPVWATTKSLGTDKSIPIGSFFGWLLDQDITTYFVLPEPCPQSEEQQSNAKHSRATTFEL
jgi:hypothetical protein